MTDRGRTLQGCRGEQGVLCEFRRLTSPTWTFTSLQFFTAQAGEGFLRAGRGEVIGMGAV